MSIQKSVLELLPVDKTMAFTSKEVFDQCKDAISINEVSTALSQLYGAGKIDRIDAGEGTRNRFKYFKQKRSVNKHLSATIKALTEHAVETVETAAEAAKPSGEQLAFMVGSAQLRSQADQEKSTAEVYEIPAFLRQKSPTKPVPGSQGTDIAVVEAEALPNSAEVQKLITSYTHDHSLMDALITICSILPDHSSLTISRGLANENDVSMDIEDGDHTFTFRDDLMAPQKAIDAYKFLQKFKDAS